MAVGDKDSALGSFQGAGAGGVTPFTRKGRTRRDNHCTVRALSLLWRIRRDSTLPHDPRSTCKGPQPLTRRCHQPHGPVIEAQVVAPWTPGHWSQSFTDVTQTLLKESRTLKLTGTVSVYGTAVVARATCYCDTRHRYGVSAFLHKG